MTPAHYVFYHDKCTDGFGAAFSAWLALGESAEYIPVNYGEIATVDDVFNKMTTSPKDHSRLYILDFSFPKDVLMGLYGKVGKVVWLDHHKTAFDDMKVDIELVMEVDAEDRYLLLDNSKSGALLTWEYFHGNEYVPKLIRNIDDRDRWQFKYDGSKEVHAALASGRPWTFDQWQRLLIDTEHTENGYRDFVKAGRAILIAQEKTVEEIVEKAMPCYVLGKKGLAVNASVHASEVGHALANKSGTFGLVWYMGKGGQIVCSLRSNGDYDVSEIARTYGGGGHRNAAGMKSTINQLIAWVST